MKIKQEIEYTRKLKNYIIKINNKEVEVKKSWYIDDISNEHYVDYEITDEDKLTDDEKDELIDFITNLD